MRAAGAAVRRLYWKAFEDNVSGLAAMLAYNLLLSVFPLALIALFVASRLLHSDELEARVFEDLTRLFPSTAEGTLTNILDRIKASTTGFGVVAIVASVWICSSFWGALDTAFCRIYHMGCRTWLRQKRFALGMLAVSLLFIAATVVVPVAQSILVAGAEDLPLGLSEVQGIVYVATLGGGIALLFLILSIIYWTVPYARVPWRAVWPGAAAATLAIAVVDYAFPAYLTSVSAFAGLGSSLVLLVIVLVWFFVIATIILAGAEINAVRLEAHAAAERSPARAPDLVEEPAAEPADAAAAPALRSSGR